MRTMYLIGAMAFVAAALVYWLGSESIGQFLMFAVGLGFTVLEVAVWLISRPSAGPAHPVEPTRTSEPHQSNDGIER